VDDRRSHYLEVLTGDGQPVDAGAATLTSGQFHDVVLAGGVAYRFPRDEETRRRLPDRVALLAALAREQLPVTIPGPLDTAHLHRPLGSCYVAVRRVPGVPSVPAGPAGPAGRGLVAEGAAQDALVRRLGELLGALSELGESAAVRRVVPRTAPEWWLGWSERVRQVLFPLMTATGRHRAEAQLEAVCTVPASGDALVHTDLGGANLLLARRHGVPVVTGVLDWDEACIGNQANDLASLAVTFGWAVAERIDAVRQADAASVPLVGAARLIAATFALQQALPAALSGDQENLDDGLSGYR
jgi:Ser/Thr protein kinase RdoA (MazF antagonist)